MSEQDARKAISEWVSIVAEEIAEEHEGHDVSDMVHEAVDGSAWVIYYHQAASIVGIADSDEIDNAYDDARELQGTDTYWELMQVMAYSILRARVNEELRETYSIEV